MVRPLICTLISIAGAEVVLLREFFAHRQPFAGLAATAGCRIARLKIGQVEGAKRFVGQNIDPEQIEVFAREIRQSDNSPNDRGGGGDAGVARDDREQFVAQIARRRPHFELRFARDDVHARLEGAIGAVIGDLDRDIEGDAEGHGSHVENRKQRMLREVAEDVPAKETGILRDQVVKAEDAEKSAGRESVKPSRSDNVSFVLYFSPGKGRR